MNVLTVVDDTVDRLYDEALYLHSSDLAQARVLAAELVEAARDVVASAGAVSERMASGYGYTVDEAPIDRLRAALTKFGDTP